MVKVKNLVEALLKLDQDTEIWVHDDTSHRTIKGIEKIQPYNTKSFYAIVYDELEEEAVISFVE